MTAHLTEEEQIETLKRWWSDNGNNLLITIGLAVAGYFGWQAWQNSQQVAAEAASALYSDMFAATQVAPGESLSADKVTTIKHLAEQLKSEYSGSTYAHNAGLLLAKLAVESGDLEAAAAELNWVRDAGPEASVEVVADLRLAHVLLAQAKPAEAMTLAEKYQDGAFAGLFAEVRGDIFVQQGQLDQARAAYALALTQLAPEANIKRNIIQLKLNDLKVAEPKSTAGEDAA